MDFCRDSCSSCFVFSIISTISLLLPPALIADGAYFSHLDAHLTEPAQKAVITWDGTTEKMILSSRLQSRDSDALAKTAWVVPIVSTSKPQVTKGSIEAFRVLASFLSETFVHKPPTYGGLHSGVTAHDRIRIGVYDVAVLEATSAEALLNWLRKNGFHVPSAAQPVLLECIQNGVRWFVANRIDFAGKYGTSMKRARRVIELLVGKKTTVRALKLRLDALRAMTIKAVLKGKPFAQSPCGKKPGKYLRFLRKEKYEELVKSCSLGPKVYEFIKRFDGWTDKLISDGGLMGPGKIRRYPRPLKVKLHHGRHSSYGQGVLRIGLPPKTISWLLDRPEKPEDYRKFLEQHLPDIADRYRTIVKTLNLDNCGRLLDIQSEGERLAKGLATPLAITFTPPQPIYPLTISQINKGSSFIDIYVVAKEPMQDKNNMLQVDKTRTLAHRTVRRLAPYLKTEAGYTVSRLSRRAQLSALTKDCILVPGPRKNEPFKAGTLKMDDKGPDAKAYEQIFARQRPQHGELLRIDSDYDKARKNVSASTALKDQSKLRELVSSHHSKRRKVELSLQKDIDKELAQFVKTYPQSSFADDALLILVDKLYGYQSRGEGDPKKLLSLYKKLQVKTFAVEDFALLETPRLKRAAHFIKCGLGHEFVKGTLALALTSRRQENSVIEEYAKTAHFEAQEYLAREAAKPLPPTPKPTGKYKTRFEKPFYGRRRRRRKDRTIDDFRYQLERIRPAELTFDRTFANGMRAFGAANYDKAERLLMDAVNVCESRTHRKLARVWFVLGECRAQLGKYQKAISAYQNMLDLNPTSMDMVPTKCSIIVVSPHVARAQMSVCHLRAGDPQTAIKLGRQAVSKLKLHLPGAEAIRAGAYYNLACAYAVTGQKDKALDFLAKAIVINQEYAKTAKTDKDFKVIKEDPGFKALLKQSR